MAKRKASVGNALEYDAVRLELENSTHHLRNVRRRVTSPPLHQGPNSDMQLQPLTFTNTDEDMEMDIEPTVTQSGAGGYSNMNIGQDSNSHNLHLHLQHRRSLGDTVNPPLVSPIPLRTSPLHSDLLSWMSTEHTQDVTITHGNNRLGGNQNATTNLITSNGLPLAAAALLESHMPSSVQHGPQLHFQQQHHQQQQQQQCPTVPVPRARSAPLPDALTRNSFPQGSPTYQPHFPVMSIQAQMQLQMAAAAAATMSSSQRLVHNRHNNQHQHWVGQDHDQEDQDHSMLSPSVTPDRDPQQQPLLMYTFPSERDAHLLPNGLPVPAPTTTEGQITTTTASGPCGPTKQFFLDDEANLVHERLMMQDHDDCVDIVQVQTTHGLGLGFGGAHGHRLPGVFQHESDVHVHQHHRYFQRRF